MMRDTQKKIIIFIREKKNSVVNTLVGYKLIKQQENKQLLLYADGVMKYIAKLFINFFHWAIFFMYKLTIQDEKML